ncbi:FecR anti-FecI sigma factor [Formosa agariphila KMM 3901]|uniref:FecR anti-FecI sigma factor n=1 Tax=Formosa agariphila (strain DSM 15362 / KCTC 12365 / LMG 23005 / KMM 3901 / M-2Alg 35-1) TaxID=1347342 RepID=T2KQL6_FORAG|nr:FecR family protein [Formosa agariphila]CDF80793.1 FecR anti-FecI sigma factor [Formosa agariphila KMM 3901]
MLNHNEKNINGLFEKHISNQTSKDEVKILNDFLKTLYENSEWDETHMGNKIKAKNDLKDAVNLKIKKSKRSFSWVKYAAVGVLLILLKLYLPVTKSLDEISFYTGKSIDSITLPDNSKIILSPNSEIVYTSNFNDKDRKVALLRGNAFFKVSKNKQKPFIVTSQDLKTTVLGTSFNIDLNDENIKVLVKTGRVKVSSSKNHEILIPDQGVLYNPESQNMRRIEQIIVHPWYKTDVTLNEISIQELGVFIQNRFGVDLIYSNEIVRDQFVTLHVSKDDEVLKIIEKLNYITNLNFKIDANEIIVTK